VGGHALLLERLADDVPQIAGEEAKSDRRPAQTMRHARHVDALAGGVDVGVPNPVHAPGLEPVDPGSLVHGWIERDGDDHDRPSSASSANAGASGAVIASHS
jgi:hypothetical protein